MLIFYGELVSITMSNAFKVLGLRSCACATPFERCSNGKIWCPNGNILKKGQKVPKWVDTAFLGKRSICRSPSIGMRTYLPHDISTPGTPTQLPRHTYPTKKVHTIPDIPTPPVRHTYPSITFFRHS